MGAVRAFALVLFVSRYIWKDITIGTRFWPRSPPLWIHGEIHRKIGQRPRRDAAPKLERRFTCRTVSSNPSGRLPP